MNDICQFLNICRLVISMKSIMYLSWLLIEIIALIFWTHYRKKSHWLAMFR